MIQTQIWSELSEVFTDSFHDFDILHSRKVKYLKNRPRSQEIIRNFGVTQIKIHGTSKCLIFKSVRLFYLVQIDT